MAGSSFFGFNTTQAKTLERLMGSDDAGLSALATSITNLNGWATALATKLNSVLEQSPGTSQSPLAH